MPFPALGAAMVAKFGAKLVRKHGARLLSRMVKARKSPAGRAVVRSAPYAGTAAVMARGGLRGAPPPLPSYGPRQPQRGPRGVGRRIVPGGRSGYTYDPYDLNTPTDKSGRPVAVHPETTERLKCPPGYVAVDLDGDGVKDACLLKGTARSMGLWKSRPKPPISGYDARAIKRAERAKKRVKKLAGDVGYKCTTKGRK